eukprot:767818-Hanusia_phi.AAC.5
MSDSRPKLDTKDVDVALRYIEERMRELALIVKDGKDRGVIGDVKVREADVNAVVRAMLLLSAADCGGEQTKSSTERKEGTIQQVRNPASFDLLHPVPHWRPGTRCTGVSEFRAAAGRKFRDRAGGDLEFGFTQFIRRGRGTGARANSW